MPRRHLWIALVTTAVLLGATFRVWALIETDFPLDGAIRDADAVFVVKVAKIDPAKPAAVVVVEQTLKGTAPANKLTLSLAGDNPEAAKQILARVDVDTRLLLITTEREKNQICLAFTNGSWFQIIGEKSLFGLSWRYTHAEIYLRRTYKGTTDELVQLITDVLAKKIKAPPFDTKEKPGLGPELSTKK